MSGVVVKVPCAPQPLACILRAGMTSRSKCASFSSSQMSWSRAGPRRPAVRIFVLSGTGAPVALVKRSGFDTMNSRFQKFCIAKRDFLALPLRTADDTAEVHALELCILVRQYVCLHIAECRLGLVLDAVVKGLDDVFFEALGARIRCDDRFAIGAGEFRVGDSENIHLDTVGQ